MCIRDSMNITNTAKSKTIKPVYSVQTNGNLIPVTLDHSFCFVFFLNNTKKTNKVDHSHFIIKSIYYTATTST